MQYTGVPFQVIAGNTIKPATAVIMSTVADNTVLASVSTTASCIVGICQQGTQLDPTTGVDNGNAALSGQNILVYGTGCVAPAELSGTSTSGDTMTYGSSTGIATTTTDTAFIVGVALESGGAGDIIRLLVSIFQHA